MIKKLRVKFIAASMLALALVLLVILGGINVMSYRKTVSDADAILSVLASNQGMFPQRMSPAEDGASRKGAPGNSSMEDGVFRKRGFSDETPYESRFFSVLLDEAGRVLGTDTGKIAAVDQTAAAEYAQEVWRSGQNRGLLGGVPLYPQHRGRRHPHHLSGLREKPFQLSRSPAGQHLHRPAGTFGRAGAADPVLRPDRHPRGGKLSLSGEQAQAK